MASGARIRVNVSEKALADGPKGVADTQHTHCEYSHPGGARTVGS